MRTLILAGLLVSSSPAWSSETVDVDDALAELQAYMSGRHGVTSGRDKAVLRRHTTRLRQALDEAEPGDTPSWDEAWEAMYQAAFAAAWFMDAGLWARECARGCVEPGARLLALERAEHLDAIEPGEVMALSHQLVEAGEVEATPVFLAAAHGAQTHEMLAYLDEYGRDPETLLLLTDVLLERHEVEYLPQVRSFLVQARDQVEPATEQHRRVKKYRRALNDHHSFQQFWGLQFPLQGAQLEGADVARRRDWRIGTQRMWFSRFRTCGSITRTKWRAEDLEDPVVSGLWRWTLSAGVDLLHLPVWWRVRPALTPFVGGGFAAGSQRSLDEDGSAMDTQGHSGPSATWGVELEVNIRYKHRRVWPIRVGLVRDVTWVRDQAGAPWEVPEHDWPWLLRIELAVGLYLGSRAELLEPEGRWDRFVDIYGAQAIYDLI